MLHRYSISLLAAGLLVCNALTSCIENEIVAEDKGDPIGFVTSVNTHSRAGHIHTTENLDSFRVYAFCPDGTIFFENNLVTKIDPDSIQNNYYHLSWNIEGGPFFYPRDAAWLDYWCYRYIKGFEGTFYNRETQEYLPKGVDVTFERQMIHNFEPVDELPDQEDPIIEHKRSYNNEVSGVELHFHHATSQIELYAYAPNRNVRVMVAAAFFCNIIDHGDIIFPQPKPYGIGDNSLYWILPERNEYGVVNEFHRRHYGDYFEEPIMLGHSIAGSIANRFPNIANKNNGSKSRADGDAGEGSEGNDGGSGVEPGVGGLYDHTDFNNDGVCDHLVLDDITQPDTLSHLLTMRNKKRNMLLVSQKLTEWNRNRHIEYTGEGKNKKAIVSDSVNNHGAYIMLLINIYNIHGTPEHMHRHQIFPYRQPEVKDENGNIVTPADQRGYDPYEFAWVAMPIDTDWKPGCKYTYILEFMGNNSGAGLYPPDDLDLFGDPSANWVEAPSYGITPAERPWQVTGPQEPINSEEYKYPRPNKKRNEYKIVPNPWVRFWDPGTEDSQHNWVKKKQGDPVLGKPIDFKVVVDEWIQEFPDIIEMEGTN
ncbi:MAG: fimbrillin family protein [Paramuribaculum sp.]|nr:fimbrillin family protein [Paramuribaculum sp.]